MEIKKVFGILRKSKDEGIKEELTKIEKELKEKKQKLITEFMFLVNRFKITTSANYYYDNKEMHCKDNELLNEYIYKLKCASLGDLACVLLIYSKNEQIRKVLKKMSDEFDEIVKNLNEIG